MLAPSAMIYGDAQLAFVLPGVRDAFEATRADAARDGITMKVADFGGARTQAVVAQLLAWRDQAVANGEPSYRVSPWGRTKHGVGGAVDFRITARPAWMSEAQAYAHVGALARPHGLLWGGNFSSPADPFHLESQQSLAELGPRWDAWQASPDYPRTGAASLLALLAILAAAALWFLLSHPVR